MRNQNLKKTCEILKHYEMGKSCIFTLILIFVYVGSCNDVTIDPFERETGVYSMYGFLEIGVIPNYIRVRDLKKPFNVDSLTAIDATVRFENLDTGTSTILRDTVVYFSAELTLNFIVEEPIVPRGRYRIIAERPDGVSVQSVATAPGITESTVEPAENVDCEEQIEFTFRNVPSPERVRMEVCFFHQDQIWCSEIGIVDQLTHTDREDELFVSLSPRNLLVDVFTPRLDGEDGRPIPPRFLFPTVPCRELQSNVIQIRYIHFGPEWDAIYPAFPVNPDDVLDVENGLGFVGAIRRDTLSVTISR